MATKKRPKRPPRSVWLVVDDKCGVILAWVHRTKRDAVAQAERVTAGGVTCRAVGPFVLAERVRER
jgi:hypothetical protein